uniref:Uncharacterized protein n=1 Tax=Noctiluca scintillans TaxID=2966 RepID=A0A7S0ZVI9_NOCSC|mmetsp:Transcript_2053/g.5924  ORF Transcript_2053/g.5924 Transcript_2053/m.5924 type:complete len:154 (+) Transcript_2053:272-733(+)
MYEDSGKGGSPALCQLLDAEGSWPASGLNQTNVVAFSMSETRVHLKRKRAMFEHVEVFACLTAMHAGLRYCDGAFRLQRLQCGGLWESGGDSPSSRDLRHNQLTIRCAKMSFVVTQHQDSVRSTVKEMRRSCPFWNDTDDGIFLENFNKWVQF